MDTSEQDIEKIITRFLEGEASEQEIDMLHKWLAEDSGNRQFFDEINDAFQTAVTLSRIHPQQTDDSWSKLSKKIAADDKQIHLNSIPAKPKSFTWLKIAASVCIIMVSGFLLRKYTDQTSAQNYSVIKSVQGNNTPNILPDGSVVWLNKNSVLEYATSFNTSSRIVKLKGEAFFDVKKNGKPFIVQTEHVEVHVKGTRFNVQAYNDESAVKTTLEEGKVELHLDGKADIYTMKPGDQVVLDKRLNQVTLKKVNPANFTAWKEEQIVFDNTPLGDIIQKLANRYRVNISADSVLAARERLTMTIEGESLDEVLDMIELSSRLKTRKENNTIILYQ